VTGFVVAVPALFMNLTEVTDLTSIGTLFAFILVSGGILVLNPFGKKSGNGNGFKVPYYNSRYFLIPIWLLSLLIFSFSGLKVFSSEFLSINTMVIFLNSDHAIPYSIFIVISFLVSFNAIRLKWSLIPVLGLITNLYLMSELGITNWMRFGIWLIIGLILYFSYGIRKSKMNNHQFFNS
jgi:hypothetical protein